MAPIDDRPGDGVLDNDIDILPIDRQRTEGLAPILAPHLRLRVGGIPATSIGLIIQAGSTANWYLWRRSPW
ncbi:hypothetical protein [Roseomonas fluvialis]|uniref:Uncharacterized protein n=1 Tax=Roseomonas fluvialis TaxID=1750527 RepID=A0ABM7XZ06_9PROT|nr:hypothetical protein [Roseomonas fluvialis]BDG70733.1 hypothetical protein Rmf_06620 [Roseomonas fluvialis]